MDLLTKRIKQLTGELKEYIEARIDLLVLNTSEQIAQWMGQSVQKITGFIILGVGLVFAMVALAIYLGEVLDNLALGYLIISVPLLVIGGVLSISKPLGIAKSVQRQFMENILNSIEEKGTEKQKEVIPKLQEQPQKQLTQGHEQED